MDAGVCVRRLFAVQFHRNFRIMSWACDDLLFIILVMTRFYRKSVIFVLSISILNLFFPEVWLNIPEFSSTNKYGSVYKYMCFGIFEETSNTKTQTQLYGNVSNPWIRVNAIRSASKLIDYFFAQTLLQHSPKNHWSLIRSLSIPRSVEYIN